jgi:hypothetical protein
MVLANSSSAVRHACLMCASACLACSGCWSSTCLATPACTLLPVALGAVRTLLDFGDVGAPVLGRLPGRDRKRAPGCHDQVVQIHPSVERSEGTTGFSRWGNRVKVSYKRTVCNQVTVTGRVRRYSGGVYDLGLHVVWCP